MITKWVKEWNAEENESRYESIQVPEEHEAECTCGKICDKDEMVVNHKGEHICPECLKDEFEWLVGDHKEISLKARKLEEALWKMREIAESSQLGGLKLGSIRALLDMTLLTR